MASPLFIFSLVTTIFTAIGVSYVTWTIATIPHEPECASLDDNDAFKDINSPYRNKYADKYRRYLIDTNLTRAKEENTTNNRDWWKYKFEVSFQRNKPTTGKFSKVNTLFDLTNTCNEAYKSNSNQVSKEKPRDKNKFWEEEIWLFCSKGNLKVQSIEEVVSERYLGLETFGSKYKSDLIAVETQSNAEYWSFQVIRFIFYYGLTEEVDSDDTSEFKKLYESGVIDYEILRDRCKLAYTQKITEKVLFPIDKVFQFCSIKGVQ